jgi:ribosomal-protein-alanine N-acetyltransferase
MRYWYPGADLDAAGAARRIAAFDDHWPAHGFGDWGVADKPDGELIGFAGLHHIADMDEVNIGYVLQRDRWRRGLGYEIAEAVLAHGFRHLRLPEVVAAVDPHNTASVGLARKCGLALRKRIVWMGRERQAYGISLQEWEAGRGGASM